MRKEEGGFIWVFPSAAMPSCAETETNTSSIVTLVTLGFCDTGNR